MKIKKIVPQLAASMMGKTPTFIYKGQQRGLMPFGTAEKKGEGKHGRFSYYISPKQFMDYTGFSEDEIIEAAETGGFGY